MEEIKCDITRTIGILSERSTNTFELNVVSWSGRDPKYDLRRWNKGTRKALKGITFSREEAETLLELLKQELE